MVFESNEKINQPANRVIIQKLGLERMLGHQPVMVMTFTKVKNQKPCLENMIKLLKGILTI